MILNQSSVSQTGGNAAGLSAEVQINPLLAAGIPQDEFNRIRDSLAHLTATVDATGVNLHWDPVGGALTYRIYRSQLRYTWNRRDDLIAEVSGGITSYLDTATWQGNFFYLIETVFTPDAAHPEGETHMLHPLIGIAVPAVQGGYSRTPGLHMAGWGKLQFIVTDPNGVNHQTTDSPGVTTFFDLAGGAAAAAGVYTIAAKSISGGNYRLSLWGAGQFDSGHASNRFSPTHSLTADGVLDVGATRTWLVRFDPVRGVETIHEMGVSDPLITSVSPDTAVGNSQPVVELAGSGLQSGGTVYLDQAPVGAATTQFDGNLGFLLPTALGVGFYDVSLVNPDGSFATFHNGFRQLRSEVRAFDPSGIPVSHAPGSGQDGNVPPTHVLGTEVVYQQVTLNQTIAQDSNYSALTVSAVGAGGIAAGTKLEMTGGVRTLHAIQLPDHTFLVVEGQTTTATQDVTLTATAFPGDTTLTVGHFIGSGAFSPGNVLKTLDPGPLPKSQKAGLYPNPLPTSYQHLTYIAPTTPNDSCSSIVPPNSDGSGGVKRITTIVHHNCSDSSFFITGISPSAVFSKSVYADNNALSSVIGWFDITITGHNIACDPDGSLGTAQVTIGNTAIPFSDITCGGTFSGGSFFPPSPDNHLDYNGTLKFKIKPDFPDGTFTVTLVNPDGSKTSSAVAFTPPNPAEPPVPVFQFIHQATALITDISPGQVLGSGSFQLSIAGYSLGPAGGTSVFLDDAPLSGVFFDSATRQLRATVPAGLPTGLYTVRIDGPYGKTTAQRKLRILNGPNILGFSPTLVSGLNGFNFTVAGEGLLPGAQLYVGGTLIPGATVNADGSLSDFIPASMAGGDYTVEIVNPDGKSHTSADRLRIQRTPRVTGISPTVHYGLQAFTLTVAGDDFAGTAQVSIDGGSFPTTGNPDGSLSVSIAAGALIAGDHSITVTNPGGGSGSFSPLTIDTTLRLTGNTPTAAYADDGTRITIAGNNIGTAGPGVLTADLGSFDSLGAYTPVITLTNLGFAPDGALRATLPVHSPAGTYRVRVVNPDAQVAYLAKPFLVRPPPAQLILDYGPAGDVLPGNLMPFELRNFTLDPTNATANVPGHGHIEYVVDEGTPVEKYDLVAIDFHTRASGMHLLRIHLVNNDSSAIHPDDEQLVDFYVRAGTGPGGTGFQLVPPPPSSIPGVRFGEVGATGRTFDLGGQRQYDFGLGIHFNQGGPPVSAGNGCSLGTSTPPVPPAFCFNYSSDYQGLLAGSGTVLGTAGDYTLAGSIPGPPHGPPIPTFHPFAAYDPAVDVYQHALTMIVNAPSEVLIGDPDKGTATITVQLKSAGAGGSGIIGRPVFLRIGPTLTMEGFTGADGKATFSFTPQPGFPTTDYLVQVTYYGDFWWLQTFDDSNVLTVHYKTQPVVHIGPRLIDTNTPWQILGSNWPSGSGIQLPGGTGAGQSGTVFTVAVPALTSGISSGAQFTLIGPAGKLQPFSILDDAAAGAIQLAGFAMGLNPADFGPGSTLVFGTDVATTTTALVVGPTPPSIAVSPIPSNWSGGFTAGFGSAAAQHFYLNFFGAQKGDQFLNVSSSPNGVTTAVPAGAAVVLDGQSSAALPSGIGSPQAATIYDSQTAKIVSPIHSGTVLAIVSPGAGTTAAGKLLGDRDVGDTSLRLVMLGSGGGFAVTVSPTWRA